MSWKLSKLTNGFRFQISDGTKLQDFKLYPSEGRTPIIDNKEITIRKIDLFISKDIKTEFSFNIEFYGSNLIGSGKIANNIAAKSIGYLGLESINSDVFKIFQK